MLSRCTEVARARRLRPSTGEPPRRYVAAVPRPTPAKVSLLPTVTTAEARALDAVDRDAIVGDLLELLAVPSVGGSDAEADIQQVLSRRLDGLGMDVDLWAMDLPSLTTAAGFPGVEVERAEAWGLVGTRPGASD